MFVRMRLLGALSLALLFGMPAFAFAHALLAQNNQSGGIWPQAEVTPADAPQDTLPDPSDTAQNTVPSSAQDNPPDALQPPRSPVAGTPLILLVRGATQQTPGMMGTPVSAAAVQTNDDISHYAQTTLENDPSIESIAISSSGVCMNYSVPAKVFGMMPVSVSLRASVSYSGAVAVDYPWYDFALSTDKATIESALSAAAQTALADNQTPNGFSPEEQAHLLDDVHGILSRAATST